MKKIIFFIIVFFLLGTLLSRVDKKWFVFGATPTPPNCPQLSKPTGLSPSGNINTGLGTIKWNPVSGASSYNLMIDNSSSPWACPNPNLCCQIPNPPEPTPPTYEGDICKGGTTATSHSYYFLPNITYYIRVVPNNACGEQGPAATATVYSIGPTTTPTPVPPGVATPTPTTKPSNTPIPTDTEPTPTGSQNQNQSPSVFIVFDIDTYLDLLPYLSVSQYDWQQVQ